MEILKITFREQGNMAAFFQGTIEHGPALGEPHYSTTLVFLIKLTIHHNLFLTQLLGSIV